MQKENIDHPCWSSSKNILSLYWWWLQLQNYTCHGYIVWWLQLQNTLRGYIIHLKGRRIDSFQLTEMQTSPWFGHQKHHENEIKNIIFSYFKSFYGNIYQKLHLVVVIEVTHFKDEKLKKCPGVTCTSSERCYLSSLLRKLKISIW